MNNILHDQVYKMKEALNEVKLNSDNLSDYFESIIEWNIKLTELVLEIEKFPLINRNIEELRELNSRMYQELTVGGYDLSYCNPTYAKLKLGLLGIPLSVIYYRMKTLIGCAYRGEKTRIFLLNELMLDTYRLYKKDLITIETLKSVLKNEAIKNVKDNYKYQFETMVSLKKSFFTSKILSENLNDIKYLYTFGLYVTSYEEQAAKFLLNLSDEQIEKMAEYIVKAYLLSFERENKNRSQRNVVGITCILGQERLTRKIIHILNKSGFIAHVSDINGTEYNRQADYDHKFDISFYLDEELSVCWLKEFKHAVLECKESMLDYSGAICINKFGEKPYIPVINNERFEFSNEQIEFYKKFSEEYTELIEKYIPERESSSSIVAYPTPEIGENFETIFEAICTINSLDSEMYETIQHQIIKALDKGNYIHVKGKDKNITDIKVQLGKLENPISQTNFLNCVAGVNIPVGEVFTSPVLEGTNGIVHVEDIYINDLNFHDLKLIFKNGIIEDYSCTNFSSEEENKKYIEENLLFPHKSLPMGEFAIGTNTLAYAVANKYKIQDRLPMLIVEKMGPHFAIGDTCFSHIEERPIYNRIDNKEMVARTNAMSELRNIDISKAYTNTHIDITLPYGSIDSISVYTESKESIEIIKHGYFVLPGTEKLNEPLRDFLK